MFYSLVYVKITKYYFPKLGRHHFHVGDVNGHHGGGHGGHGGGGRHHSGGGGGGGHHGGGGYGGHHGGGEYVGDLGSHFGSHHGYGGHGGGHGGGYGGGGHGGGYGKDAVPADSTVSAQVPIEKIIPSDDSLKEPLDFVAEAEKIQQSKQVEEALKQPENVQSNVQNIVPSVQSKSGISRDSPHDPAYKSSNDTNNTEKSETKNSNLMSQKNKTENAQTRNFLKPVGFKGSILKDYKKHWDDEDKSRWRDF